MKKHYKGQIESELRLAREDYQKGNAAKAIQRIDAVLQSNPESVASRFGKATMLLALDRKAEALDAFSEALRYEPANVEVLFWAAQVSLQVQRPEQSEAFARKLVRLQPRMDQAFYLLAIAQSMSGRWLEALDSIESGLAIQPTNLDYIVRKAQLLCKLQLNTLAIEQYRKGLRVHAEPQIAFELAETLLEEGQFEEALSLLEQYGSRLPPEGKPYALMGRAYTESQQFDQAEPHWIEAGKLSTDQVGLIAARAKSETLSGRIDVAERLLREAMEQNPSAVQLFGLLTPITKISASDSNMVRAMEQALQNENLEAVAKQGLCYALGKAQHDLGDYEKAIAFFDEANRIRGEFTPNNLKFDVKEWKARVDFQIEFFTVDRIASLEKEGLDSEKPLFIVGIIRSGTTLTEQILSSHWRIASAGESRFWVDHRDEFANPITQRFDLNTAKRRGDEYLRVLNTWGLDARYVIDKNPMNMLITASLHCVFPAAKMIHVKRNAVDNLLSIWMTPLTNGLQFISTREDLVFAYREYLRLAAHLEATLPADRFMTISYEELTSEPIPTIERMLGFLGLDPEAACFHPEKNPRTVRTPSVYQVRQPINVDSQTRWKMYEPWLGPFRELLKDGAI